jgi:hypothetical protein
LSLFPPHFSQICKALSTLFIFSKSQPFALLILCMVFLCLFSIDFCSYFYNFSPSACFGFSLFLFFSEFEM